MASKKKKKKQTSPTDVQGEQADARAAVITQSKGLLRKVAKHVADGGSSPADAWATEKKLMEAKFRIEKRIWTYELRDDPECVRLEQELSAAMRGMGDAAAETRKLALDARNAQLNAEEKQRRAAMGGYEKELEIMRLSRR